MQRDRDTTEHVMRFAYGAEVREELCAVTSAEACRMISVLLSIGGSVFMQLIKCDDAGQSDAHTLGVDGFLMVVDCELVDIAAAIVLIFSSYCRFVSASRSRSSLWVVLRNSIRLASAAASSSRAC